MQPQQFNRNRY